MTSIFLAALGFVLLVGVSLLLTRALTRSVVVGDREELHVSRGWLAAYQARQSGD